MTQKQYLMMPWMLHRGKAGVLYGSFGYSLVLFEDYLGSDNLVNTYGDLNWPIGNIIPIHLLKSHPLSLLGSP
jgi:hypothetical protein